MEIIIPKGFAPVFRKFEGQNEAQDAYVELRPEENLLIADYDGEIGNAVPFSVVHGRVLRWGIPADISREGLEKLLEGIRPYAEQIVKGYSSEWNGSNLIGHLTPEAEAANRKIIEICDSAEDDFPRLRTYSCEDWLQASSLEEVWPAGQTLEDAVVEQLEFAVEEDVVLSDDMEQALLDKLMLHIERGGEPTPEQVDALREHCPDDAERLLSVDDDDDGPAFS